MTGIIKIIIEIRERYANEIAPNLLTKDYLERQNVSKVDNKYYIPCKSFDIYINPKTRKCSMCIGEKPISTLYIETIEQYNEFIEILKEEGELLP